MTDHEVLALLARALSTHRNANEPIVDAIHDYDPDWIDRIEHEENERAARDGGCECD